MVCEVQIPIVHQLYQLHWIDELKFSEYLSPSSHGIDMRKIKISGAMNDPNDFSSIKKIGGKSRNSRFPIKPKQQKKDILKEINSFSIVLLNFALFSHFSACSDIATNFFSVS